MKFFNRNFLLFIIYVIYWTFSIYKIFTLPISIDEACTYNWFVNKSLWDCISFFPSTNNHIFFSIISWSIKIIFGKSLFLFRLPSLIVGSIGIFITYKSLKKLFLPIIADLLIILFSFNYIWLMYSFLARGYSLYILFSIITTFLIIEKLLVFKNKLFGFTYILFSILGFYTMLSYIYVITIQIFIFIIYTLFNKRNLSVVIKYLIQCFIIIVISFILYLPVVIRNGIDSIFNNNPWISPTNYYTISTSLFPKLKQIFNYLLGIRFDFFLIALTSITFLVYIYNKNKKYKILSLVVFISLLSPLWIMLLHKVVPYPRTYSFLIIAVYLGIGIIFNLMLVYIKLNNYNLLYEKIIKYEKLKYLFLLIVSILSIYLIQKNHRNYIIKEDLKAKEVAKTLLTIKGKNFYFIGNTEWEYHSYIFYSSIKQKSIPEIKTTFNRNHSLELNYRDRYIYVNKYNIEVDSNDVVIVDNVITLKYEMKYKKLFSNDFSNILAFYSNNSIKSNN